MLTHTFQQPSSWSLERIGAPLAWTRVRGLHAPLVAVLDTGLDVDHPALLPNLWRNPKEVAGNHRDDDHNGVVDDVHGFDAIGHSGDLTDRGEHGTHVAGIVAAHASQVTGLAWEGRVLPIKIFDDQGNSDVDSVCDGIRYAAAQGARILCCSWGAAMPFNPALFESMRDFPGLIVCSAGNQGSDNDRQPHYPSSFELDHVIAVGASSRQDRLCFTSNYGAQSVDLVAPGEQILSTVPGGRCKVKSGTSQAAPQVAAAAALLWEAHPDWSRQQVKEQLLASVDGLPQLQGKVASGGRLNVARALELRGGHGPHLLRDFVSDVERSRQEALQADNRFPDLDPRPGFVELGDQQTLITPRGVALRERDPNGDWDLLVWLESDRQGERLRVDQRGFQRDALGAYAFPLHLEGPPTTPFDPPEAERISAEHYEQALSEFEQAWLSPATPGEVRAETL